MRRLFLAILAFVASGCDSSAVSRRPSSDAAESQPQAAAGDVRLSIENFEGIQSHIARNLGKVVVMDAWSTSCAPCIKEFHNLVELSKEYPPDQLACISLSFDYEGIGQPEEQQDRVLKFLREQGAAIDNLMSSEESDVLYRKFHLAAVPAVFVYDRAGQLRKRFDNEKAKSKDEAFSYEQVRQLVAELIEEDAPAANSDSASGPK